MLILLARRLGRFDIAVSRLIANAKEEQLGPDITAGGGCVRG